jgi:uncharacterized protein YfiM (DUF2279 family)
MPTVLDVLGIPASAAAGMEGRSLRPMWEGRETGGRYAFSEALAYESEQKSVAPTATSTSSRSPRLTWSGTAPLSAG